MIDEIKRTDCTGCKMCADICPNHAISYEADKKGFWYPAVEHEECDKCGLCTNTCPSLSAFEKEAHNPDVYAAWLRDDTKRLQSTSGGIYYALAKHYIGEGKYVAGCRYSDSYKGAFHLVSNLTEDLEKIIGSKYFQSDTGGIYRQVKALLDDREEVLFCGTPCQSAALQKYLKKPYSNLLTVDFICKGVTSPQVYSKYISELEKRFRSKVVSVHMKDKRTGWQSLGLRIKFQNGKEYFREGKDDPWVRGYVQENLYTRPSCYYCRYRALLRISDITVGDFWGIQGSKKADLFKGISLVMINSAKGDDLFDQIKGDIFFEERSLYEVIQGNPSILINNPKGRQYEKFFKLLDSMSVSESIKKCLKK